MLRYAFLLLLAATLLTGCDSGGSAAEPEPPALGAAPVVSGFYFRSEQAPDLPGEACGAPERTASPLLGAVPNPYLTFSLYEAADRRIVQFITLPQGTRVEIVPARWEGEPAPERGGEVVRVLEQREAAPSLDWGLRDADSALVPSGFYRVTFVLPEGAAESVDAESDRVFEDLYIIQREDRETWEDPTGCLDPNWSDSPAFPHRAQPLPLLSTGRGARRGG